MSTEVAIELFEAVTHQDEVVEGLAYFNACVQARRVNPGKMQELRELAIQALREKQERDKGCEYCKTPSKYLAVIENTDPRIFISVQGSYLQIFDEEYPGFVDNVEIDCCPKCGKTLKGAEREDGGKTC